MKKLNENEIGGKGFTIIETLIVLAIAGLILMIVFLAVPALQRAARNTQRKNDVAAIGSAISNYVNNDGGSMPSAPVVVSGTSAVFSNTAVGPNSDQAKLGFYSPGNVVLNTISGTSTVTPVVNPPGTGPSATVVTTDSVVIEVGETCNSSGTSAGQVSSRAAAIFYVVESASGNGNIQCLED